MGPLNGIRVVELGGRGPVRFCGMVLADLGAEVITVHRPRAADDVTPFSVNGLGRRRRTVMVDLRSDAGRSTALKIVARADALIEGFRPGTAERLGLGPADCAPSNPRLVYGRMTGWGQNGPFATQPGHDINYLAVAGVLGTLGRADSLPAPPMNLIADGGGAMLLAVGVLAAVLESRTSGRGQVVDAAMVDGAALLSTMSHEMRNDGTRVDERGKNVNDSGAPFYDVYLTADGRCIAIGAVEDSLWNRLLVLLGISDVGPERWDRANWPGWRARLEAVFAQRTQAQWCELAERSEVGLSPVLSMADAPDHAHNLERGVFTRLDTGMLPSPAPRFSRTPLAPLTSAPADEDETQQVLLDLGIEVEPADCSELR